MNWHAVTPFPGNTIFAKRLESMRREFGGYVPDIVGSPAIADNSAGAFPELPEDALVIVDGNHRRELAAMEGQLDDEFLAEIHRGKTRKEVHFLRRGLNDRRAIKPPERFLELVAEGDITRNAIKEAVEGLGFEISHFRRDGALACTNELEWIWRHDHVALVRALDVYVALWGHRGQDYSRQGAVVKALGAFWIVYPKADVDHLVKAVRRTKLDPNGLYETGKGQSDSMPALTSVTEGIRYVLATIYNKGRRAGAVVSLFP